MLVPSSAFAQQSFTVSEIDEFEAEPTSFPMREINSFNKSLSQRDITDLTRISTSSSKLGHPADNLRVFNIDDVNKLWQSDGLSPHYILLELEKQTLFSELKFYLDLQSDESYTPRTIVIQLGNSLDNLTDFTTLLCDNPQGWVCVDLSGAISGADGRNYADFVRASMIKILITSNYQLGRDSRVRGVRLFSPELPASYHQHYDSQLQKFLKS